MVEYVRQPNVPKGIRFIRGAYWFLVACGILAFLGKLAHLPSVQKYSVAVISFNSLVHLAILFGIYKKKIWLVPLILLYSYLNIVGLLVLVVLTQASDIAMLKEKVVHIIVALFWIYQVIVFSRKETRLYYRERGQTII